MRVSRWRRFLARLPQPLARALADPLGYILAVIGCLAGAVVATTFIDVFDEADVVTVMRGEDIVADVLLGVPLAAGVGATLVLLIGRRTGAIRTGIAAALFLIVAGIVTWALGPLPEATDTLQTRALVGLALTAVIARVSVATIPPLRRRRGRSVEGSSR